MENIRDIEKKIRMLKNKKAKIKNSSMIRTSKDLMNDLKDLKVSKQDTYENIIRRLMKNRRKK